MTAPHANWFFPSTSLTLYRPIDRRSGLFARLHGMLLPTSFDGDFQPAFVVERLEIEGLEEHEPIMMTMINLSFVNYGHPNRIKIVLMCRHARSH